MSEEWSQFGILIGLGEPPSGSVVPPITNATLGSTGIELPQCLVGSCVPSLTCSEVRSIWPAQRKSIRREREFRWMKEHGEELRRLAGQWIVLEGDEMIAHGHDPVSVVREARSKGVRKPFVYRIEGSRPKGIVCLGL